MKYIRNKTSLKGLKHFLGEGGAVNGIYPNIKELINNLNFRSRNNTVKLLYGETYDLLGITVDSLKYYFFISLLHLHLEQNGLKVESTINIADEHSALNPSVAQKNKTLKEGKNRQKLIEKIIKIYNLPVKTVLISKLLSKRKVKEEIKSISKLVSSSPIIQKKLESAVLKNRIKQEKKSGFRYAIEQIAVSKQFDIKIGPPREQIFDELVNLFTKKKNQSDFIGIYLTPTYPLGKDFSYFLTHPEIEKFGLTPYKAGSNKLHRNRIILGETAPTKTKKLIEKSFIPDHLDLPNPVTDLLLISTMAKRLIQKNVDTSPIKLDLSGSISNQALTIFTQQIYKPLHRIYL